MQIFTPFPSPYFVSYTTKFLHTKLFPQRIHVRRTDKVGTEAAFHSIDEYMTHVDNYYTMLKLSQPDVVKRVYLASDDPTVITEAQKKWVCCPAFSILINDFSTLQILSRVDKSVCLLFLLGMVEWFRFAYEVQKSVCSSVFIVVLSEDKKMMCVQIDFSWCWDYAHFLIMCA